MTERTSIDIEKVYQDAGVIIGANDDVSAQKLANQL